MSKHCDLCEKITIAGRRIQHHHSIGWRYKAPRTNRVFKPNLRKVDIVVDGKKIKVSTCMKCYKRLRKDAEQLNVATA